MKQATQPGDGSRGSGSGERPRDVAAALAEVDALLAALGPDLAPECIPGHRIGSVIAALGAIERRARGARLLLRKAAADTGAWKAAGARSAAEHVAKQEGISVGQARSELAASEKLAALPTARDAVASGELSVEKAKAVAEAGAADPSAEQRLVDTARQGDLRDTQDEARRTIVRADERSGERALRVHRRRSLKTWLTVDGEGHGVWNIPAEAHHRFLAALEPYRRQAFRDARANGVRLSDEALMADALDLLARDVLLDLDDSPAGSSNEAGPRPAEPGSPAAPAQPDRTDGPGATDGLTLLPTADAAPCPTEATRCAPGGLDTRNGRTHVTPGADTDAVHPTPAPASSGCHGRSDPGGAAVVSDAGGDAIDGGGQTPASPERPGPTTTPDTQPPAPDAAGARRGRHRRPPAQVTVMVDYDALLRGHAVDGETCEVTGLGPVPVALVRQMMGDCVLRLVVTGTDVTVVSSQRRYVPAGVRAAIWARDGGTCVVPGCHATRGLEIDHCHVDFARDGPTALWNSALLCKVHHVLKTIGGWGLAGDHDQGWTFTPPGASSTEGPSP